MEGTTVKSLENFRAV